MTRFAWDSSHYDDDPAERDGIDLYTHKVTDGNHFYRDIAYGRRVTRMRALGVPVLGSYHVLHPGTVADVQAQVDWWVGCVTEDTPWWRDYDDVDKAFVWQLDCEPFNYLPRAPNKAEIECATDRLLSKSIRVEAVGDYCPRWVYADVSGLRGWIWASNYGSNPVGPYRDVYPGDTSPRWAPYGKPVEALQYGSNTIIAKQPTSDASGFRYATVAQLVARLRGTPPPPPNGGDVARTITDEDIAAFWNADIDLGTGVLPAREALRLAWSHATNLDNTAVPNVAKALTAVGVDVTDIKEATVDGVTVDLTDEQIGKIIDGLFAKLTALGNVRGTWEVAPAAQQ